MEKPPIRDRDRIKKELRRLYRSMDFVNNKFLNKKNIDKKEFQKFFDIYQQLGLTWEFLGLQCKHWDGYKRARDKKEICRICGKIKDVDDLYYLVPQKGLKKIGKKLKPNSKKTFNNKKEAKILDDTINFHGALLTVDVHNSYKSRLPGDKYRIDMAAERIVKLRERDIDCHIDQHLIHIRMNKIRKKAGKNKYGGFPWEIKREKMKKFPVIFDCDEKYQFLGLTILG